MTDLKKKRKQKDENYNKNKILEEKWKIPLKGKGFGRRYKVFVF